MQAVPHCRAISSPKAFGVEVWTLRRRAFLPLVAPRQISATAANSQTIGRRDSPFATLSVDLSIAAGKRAHSFWRPKKPSNKPHRPKKKQHATDEQNQAQARPAFTCRIGENERSDSFWRNLGHES